MRNKGTYPSKIMLVGEYGVLLGGSALTIPYHKLSARFRSVTDIPPRRKEEARQSSDHIRFLYDYLKGLPAANFHAPPDLDHFSAHLGSYWLDLNIPIGFGLGSSGAVSAAIYDTFFPGADVLTLQQQKEDMAAIESYFHGKSSGLDALTCLQGAPLLLHNSGHIEVVKFNPTEIPGAYRFFLLNFGERFDTRPLVNHFLSKMKDAAYKRCMEEEYLPLNKLLIASLLGEGEADPALLVKSLSGFQLEYFRKMIPEKAIDPWIEGLVSNEYYLKLNGSGGGMMLGFTHDSFVEALNERWGDKLNWIGRPAQ